MREIMYIALTKDQEDKNIVTYYFETNVAGNLIITDQGKTRQELITKKGYCTFNKNTNEFELHSSKTDDYFFNKENREALLIHVKLAKLNKTKKFPDAFDFATG